MNGIKKEDIQQTHLTNTLNKLPPLNFLLGNGNPISPDFSSPGTISRISPQVEGEWGNKDEFLGQSPGG